MNADFDKGIKLVGFDKLINDLPKMHQVIIDAHYFAAINSAEDARDKVRREMDLVFNQPPGKGPTPFIKKALRVTSGTGGPVGLTIKKTVSGNTTRVKNPDRDVTLRYVDAYETLQHDPVLDTLEPQILGGSRRSKPVEKRLRSNGVLRPNEFLVVAKSAKTNKYGNVSQGEYVRMLSDLRTFNEGGYVANSKYKKGRGHYIVLSGRGFRGIFKSTGGYGEAALRGAQLIWIIVKGAPTYSKRLPFYELGRSVFEKRYPQELQSILQRRLDKVFFGPYA